MVRVPAPWFGPGVALALVGGFVDAQALLATSNLFAGQMGADTARLAAGLTTGDWSVAAVAGALVMAFVAGVIGGEVAARAAPRRLEAMAIALSSVLILAAAAIGDWPSGVGPLLLAAAMGARYGGGPRGIPHVTEALVRLGRRLADALMGTGPRWDWLPELLLWAAFAVGAALGASGYLGWGPKALWLAGIGAAAIAAWLWVQPATAPGASPKHST